MEFTGKIKSRDGKLAGRVKFRANPVNGVSMKRLLVERQAKAQKVALENRRAKTTAL